MGFRRASAALAMLLSAVLTGCQGTDGTDTANPGARLTPATGTTEPPEPGTETGTLAASVSPAGTRTRSPAAPTVTDTEAADPAATGAPAALGRESPEISAPEGIGVYRVAEGLANPTAFALDAAGRLFVAEAGGTVRRLVDEDGDGFFESAPAFVELRGTTLGIVFAPEGAPGEGDLYVSHEGVISVVPVQDGRAGEPEAVIDGLPTGSHQNNSIAFGPDGRIYFGLGSTCNECIEDDERSATVLAANADGSGLEVFAKGLRNPYGLIWVDGELWATDNGSDPACTTPDELNLVREGGDYGWPYCADGGDSPGEAPVAVFGDNNSSNGIAYQPGLWEDYELFVAQYGAHDDPSIGRRVVAIRLDGEGDTEVTSFVQARDPETHLQRPLPILAEPATGGLLVGDFATGVIYRIAGAR